MTEGSAEHASAPSIWEKIDLEEYLAAQAVARSPTTETTTQEPKTGWRLLKHRIFWWALKFAAVAFWFYVPTKLFVADVDRWVVARVNPSLAWILDYRFFIFLGLLAVALLFLRRWLYLAALTYVLLFPVIVAFFYLPRLLHRQRTWMPTIGLLNVLWTTFRTLRFSVATAFLFSVAALAIAIDALAPVQAAAVAALILLWTILLARACLAAVNPVSFIKAQQRAISKLQASDPAQNIAAPSQTHLRPEVVKLSKTEIDQVVMSASGAVCIYAVGYFLADQLERYRRSGASVIFSVIGIAILFLEAIAVFTLANLGIHHLDKDQFAHDDEPSFAAFVRYTLNSLFPGDIEAIQPVGEVATWVSVYAGVSVGIIVLTLIVALVFSVRSAREDALATESIAAMRERSDEYAARLVREYRLPLEELISRLMEMGGIVNLWLRFVSTSLGKFRSEVAERDT